MRKAWAVVVMALASFGISLFGLAPAEAQRAVPQTREQIQLSYAPLVREAAPAVVNIYTSRMVAQQTSPFLDDPFFQRFFGGENPFGQAQPREQNSLGSGVVVRGDGTIITNAHVIQGAEQITVVLADRREFKARVVLEDDRVDLAVLKIDPGAEQMPFLALSDSDDLAVGDLVLAIGNPFGVGQTVTSGIVSAVARSAAGVSDYNFFIQTDAAINPGNSGGALIAMDGSLVGINSAIYSRDGGSLGIGFAIPSNMVEAVIRSADAGGKPMRAWLGASGQAVDRDTAQTLGLARPAGVLIDRVYDNSPAARAGLRAGDVVTAINGRAVDEPQALRFRIALVPIGEKASLTVRRRGAEQTLTFDAIVPPENPPRDLRTLRGANPLGGATVANPSPALAEEIGGDFEPGGVVVMGIERRSNAARVGLRTGDAVLEINNAQVTSTSQLESLLARPAQRWAIKIRRDGQVLDAVIGG
jgi:serine protease Do